MELFPRWSRELWKEWHMRSLVLLSLTCQILLICLGNRRKYSHKLWIRVVVWCTYIAADSVATVALGVLSSNLEDIYDNNGNLNVNVELTALWAPFMLLHLGGPDTTAYSLEDNELWLRHLLGLIVQSIVTVYISLMAWTGSRLSVLTILMILVGLIKYGERTWVLRSSSREHLKDYFRSIEGSNVDFMDSRFRGEDIIVKAYKKMDIVRLLFGDKSVSLKWNYWLLGLSAKDTFKLIEIENGFMYDLFYTKARLVYTRWGILLRLISFSLTCIVFLVISLVAKDGKKEYSKIDMSITFLLLSGAIILEIYAMVSFFFSDWTTAWLLKNKRWGSQVLVSLQKNMNENRRWSNSIAQFSLLSFCCRPKNAGFKWFSRYFEMIEEQKYISYVDITDILKERIFGVATELVEEDLRGHDRSIFEFLPFKYSNFDSYQQYLDEKNLLKNIIIWHIATEICYYTEDDTDTDRIRAEHQMSFHLSQYMSSFLVTNIHMLPEDLPDEFLRVICQGMESQYLTGRVNNKRDIYRNLLRQYAPSTLDRDNFKQQIRVSPAAELPYLKIGVSLAALLHQSSARGWKWEMITDVWLGLLFQTAYKTKGVQNGQQLRRGGELLTHIWLLIGLSVNPERMHTRRDII